MSITGILTCVVMGLFLSSASLLAAPSNGAAPPATRPAAVRNGWDGSLFDFKRPEQLVVEESTPTPEQIDWRKRAPQMPEDVPDLTATGPAAPAQFGDFNAVRLRFKDADGEVVTALLCTPRDRKGPFPLVVAVHGWTSNKAQVCAQVGTSLTKRGFAVLAPDLPRHGERPGEPRSVIDRTNPVKSFFLARRSINDVRQCIDLAQSRPDIDTKAGVTLLGYSLGSWINSVAAPLDERVSALVLMVGGAADIPAPMLLVPQVAACDPRLALAHFAGRGPIFMLNGKQDFTVKADMATRLYESLPEPRKQVWYDCGHILTQQAYEDAAAWVAETMEKNKGARVKQEDAKAQRKAG